MAGSRVAMLVSLLLCLFGALMIIGALGVEKWQSPAAPGASAGTRKGLRQVCNDDVNICVDLPMNTTSNCCEDTNNIACVICMRYNEEIRGRQATMACAAIACIFFLIGAILEAAGLVGKKHSKKNHGIACLMLFTTIFAFAAIGVYGIHVADVDVSNSGSAQEKNFSDSFALVGASGAVAFIVMLMSLFFLRK